MGQPLYPSLYEINTRVWLGEISQDSGKPATLDAVPDTALDRIAALGFDWVWLLGVWQTGAAGRAVSRGQPHWRQEFAALLPDLTDEDICGSPFAIQSYSVHGDFGGNEALLRMRERLHARDLRLMLDFVPNHTAIDHPWAWEHPEFYIQGDDADLERAPADYARVETCRGPAVLAHGRELYFAAWPDTLQLNYRHSGLCAAMSGELVQIARLCDGVRCDMAMLLLPDIFLRIWGNASLPVDGSSPADGSFWREAIARTREIHPQFVFLAEAYWDLESALQQQGFDYTYDKRLYDRLHLQDTEAVRGHLRADAEYQRKSARFLENHDEPRAAAVFPPPVHRAAAVLTYLVPGLRFFHEGQLDGRRAKASVHLARRPTEPADPAISGFYSGLLECLRGPVVRSGCWRLLSCRSAWEGNVTAQCFIAFCWEGVGANAGGDPIDGQRLLVAANYGPTQGQCYVDLPFAGLRDNTFLLRDVLGSALYEREGTALADGGLYLDLPEWGYHVFEIEKL